MLLEFKGQRVVTCNATDHVEAPSYALISQITDVSETTLMRGEGMPASVGSAVGLRSGRVLMVRDSLRDVLDALKFVTRHISVGPGLVDRVDGENDAVYPWHRSEKVSVLAEKWRAHERKPRQSGVPVYGPCEPDTRKCTTDESIVDLSPPVPPLPPENRVVDPMMNGADVVAISTGELIETFKDGGEDLLASFAAATQRPLEEILPPLTDRGIEVDVFQAGDTPEAAVATLDSLIKHLNETAAPPTDQPKETDVDQNPSEGS
jgi:hypothetical protein